MLACLLYNLRSAHNVGAVLRTADGAGFQKVFLCGTTPAPIDRFGRVRNDVAKVALGAEEGVAWEYHPNALALLHTLRAEGVCLVALEQSAHSLPYDTFTPEKNRTTVCVLGEETKGLPEEVLALCDAVLEIPMYGKKESLNVSVAFGVLAYALKKSLLFRV